MAAPTEAHPVKVSIDNRTPLQWVYKEKYFSKGDLVPGSSPPPSIPENGKAEFECCGTTASPGGRDCSGRVTYRHADTGTLITVAFSNLDGSTNQIGFGTGDPEKIFASMATQDYKPVETTIMIDGKPCDVTYQCTGGDVNFASVTITAK